MKILYVIKGLGLGGAEMHLLQLCNLGKDAGYDIEVVYFNPKKSALVPSLSEIGVKAVCFTFNLEGLSAFKALVVKNGFDIVHFHSPRLVILARFILWGRFGPKFVSTEHIDFSFYSFFQRFLWRLSRSRVDSTISCSKAVAQSLPIRSIAIQNGIKLHPAATPPTQGTLAFKPNIEMICVANFRPQKNHLGLLQALEKFLPTAQRSYRLTLVGAELESYQDVLGLLKNSTIKDSVRIIGKSTEVDQYLCESDVFLLVSLHEGLPLSLLEAMERGLLCVVSAVPGMLEAVNNDNGLVVEIGSVDSIVTALRLIDTDFERLRAKGRLARQTIVENFSEHKMFEDVTRIYKELVNG